MTTLAERSARLSLSKSFGVAAWVVILGVAATWIFLKQGVGEAVAHLPEVPQFTLTTVQDVTEVTWLERAEQAYAAGRITRPAGDSALHFYQQTLKRDPQNEAALDGIKRVMGYLINGAESALLAEDWSMAADYAQQALAVDAQNLAAKSVMSRVQRYDRVKELSDRAVDQIAQGNLTKPTGNNALASYREILSMDPGNVVARQGIESVAQRLATIAQTEAFAENHDRAQELIALAKSIAPNAPGIAQTEKLTLQWTDMVKDQSVKEDLLAAARAMQNGHLIGIDSPSGVGALEHYQSVLKKDPDSAAAKSGVQLVINGLIERVWSAAGAEDLAAMQDSINLAQQAGASAQDLADVNEELDFLQRRRAARAGEFDDVLGIGNLTARRQGAPVLSRNVEAGWVELLFTVTEEGDVTDVVVVQSTNEALIEPALSAVQKWRFDPYLDNGRPLPVRSGVRFSFQS